MVKATIFGGEHGESARISEVQSLFVNEPLNPPLPSLGTPTRQRFFNQLVSDDGLASGVTNMNVDGSATAQEFFLPASQDGDIWIRTIAIVIADTAIVHNNFGNISALSNGTGSTDAQTIAWDMTKLIPGGLRIGRGTIDRLTSVVNDNLTGLTEFTVRALGYLHLPNPKAKKELSA
jgi:hypothetical protein